MSDKPTKAYHVERSIKGTELWVVYAHSAREARERFVDLGEPVDTNLDSSGVRSVRRAPADDRVP